MAESRHRRKARAAQSTQPESIDPASFDIPLPPDCDSCELMSGMTTYLKQRQPKHGQPVFNSPASEQQQSVAAPEMDLPPDLNEVGRSGWTLLHTTAAYYPQQPSQAKKDETKNFLHYFAKIFPCTWCAVDFQNYINKNPPKLDSKQDFGLWMCDAHNDVNRKLGKPEFDCAKIGERWDAAAWQQLHTQQKQ